MFFQGHRLKIYPLSINSRYFSVLRASASMAVVTGLHEEQWFRRLGARASTTVTSHTSCLPISQGIMVTPSGRLPSVRYSPRGSSIEGKSRDPNGCFMRELRVAWRDQHSWCKKDSANRPVELFYHSGTYAQRRCWLRHANQLNFEVADLQVSGLGSCKEPRSAIETRICRDGR